MPGGSRWHARTWPTTHLPILIAGLALLTSAVAINPAIHGHLRAPAVDLVLDTVAAVVSLIVGLLAWVRWRERGELGSAFHAGAFMALAVAYGVAVLVTITRDGGASQQALVADEQVYVFMVARVLMALLFVVGEVLSRRYRKLPHVRVVPLLPACVVAGVAVLVYTGGLPAGAAVFLLPAADGAGLPQITPIGGVAQGAVAVLLLVAARSVRHQWRRSGAIADAWISVGLIFAAFAELHWALYPSGHPGHVSTGDLLRLVCFLALLCGIEAEARWTLGRLRMANGVLAERREAELARATLEERARLARELHDGLAQELWLAKLKLGQLTGLNELPPSARPLAVAAEAAIDMGLAEARQAVMALRIATDDGLSLCDLMDRYVDDFQDRFGLRAEFTCDGDGMDVPPRVQVEVLRIAQEALTNARQHASATVVGIRLDIHNRQLTLTIADNGDGFDPAVGREGSYGLASMHERAAVVGGSLEVISAPGDGTRVVLTVPLADGPAAEKGAAA